MRKRELEIKKRRGRAVRCKSEFSFGHVFGVTKQGIGGNAH